MNNYIKDGERIDDLQLNGLKIIQNPKGFCFGIDAVLLSNFCKIKKNQIAVEFGTGTGIIPILLSAKTEVGKIYTFEVQEDVANMARRSIEMNGLSTKIELIVDNLKNYNTYLQNNLADVVFTNPPYFKSNSAIINPTEYKAISRHEILCNIEDIVFTSSKLLKTNGNLYMIHRPDRLVDIIYLCRKYKLEPKEIRFVQPRSGKKANLMLIRCNKNGRPELKYHDPLIVYNDDGSYTDEIFRIYNEQNITIFDKK